MHKNFCVCKVATEADAILGTDFLSKMDARLDFANGKICLKVADKVGHDQPKGEHCESRGTAARAALTVFSHKEGRSKQRSCWIGHRTRDERQVKQREKTEPEIELKESESWLVKTTQEIRVAQLMSRADCVSRVMLLDRMYPAVGSTYRRRV